MCVLKNLKNMHPCTKCQYVARSLSDLVVHYRFNHQHEHDFHISCEVDNCAKTFNLTESYLKHVKRRHPNFHETHFSRWRHNNRIPSTLSALHEIRNDEDDPMESNDAMDLNNEIQNTDRNINFKKKYALFLLKLREGSKLSSNAVMKVVTEMIDTIGYHHAEITDNIIKLLNDNSINPQIVDSVKDIFNCKSQGECALIDLNSEYKLNKYIRESFGYVEPVEYNLSNHQTSLKNGKYQYVPVQSHRRPH